MSWTYIISSFFTGTFKYLFGHVLAVGYAAGTGDEITFVNIFLPTYVGAIVSMSIFYFTSDFFMDRAKLKRQKERELAIASGKVLKVKKKFTKLNKFMVKVKTKLGIYVFTLIAPLFFSIPIGSIICAKFYGDQKKTFPLMVLFTLSYGVIVSLVIVLING